MSSVRFYMRTFVFSSRPVSPAARQHLSLVSSRGPMGGLGQLGLRGTSAHRETWAAVLGAVGKGEHGPPGLSTLQGRPCPFPLGGLYEDTRASLFRGET